MSDTPEKPDGTSAAEGFESQLDAITFRLEHF